MIEGIKIEGFRCLQSLSMGKLLNQPAKPPLSSMVAITGKSGTGKTAIFEALSFLSDCLIYGVARACRANLRGSYEKIATIGQEQGISFEICWRQSRNKTPQSYMLDIVPGENGLPRIQEEALVQWDKKENGQKLIREWTFIRKGVQCSVMGRSLPLSSDNELILPALAALGSCPLAQPIANFFGRWHISRFDPLRSRSLTDPRKLEHMNPYDCNLGTNIAWMMEKNKKKTEQMLQHIASKLSGVSEITFTTGGSYPVIMFQKGKARLPLARMSNGNLRLFYYLLLLEGHNALICLDEFDTSLNSEILGTLVPELRKHSKKCQIFFTTQNTFVFNRLCQENEIQRLERAD